MNDLIKDYKEREALREKKSKEFFVLAKSKLNSDIRDYLLEEANKDKFEWSSSMYFGNESVYINGDNIHASFIENSYNWNYYIYGSCEYKQVSEKDFLRYLKLSVFS